MGVDRKLPLLQPLWECPRCARRFANGNQFHFCSDVSLEDPSEVDVEVEGWLAEAYSVGEQKHLRRKR